MTKTCPRCTAANPPEASFCCHDGNPLDRNGAAARPHVAPRFLTPFVFPSGQACQDFDQLALACQKQWATAVTMLHEGHLERFLGALGRVDLVLAARAAAGYPDSDRGLDQFLARLPTRQLAAPKLQVAPAEINLGSLQLGADTHFDLRLANKGMRLLYGTVSSECAWLGFADRPGVAQKLFQFGGETVLRVHVHGKHLLARAKELEGRLTVESNGGTATVTVRATVAVKPFPDGPLAGATSPRQIAEKAKKDPPGAAALFAGGAVARWFTDNGWTYPVKGAAANGLAAVQQFFEALGLTRPPKVTLSEKAVRLEAEAGASVRHILYVRTQEKRHVFAEARSDQPWLKVHPARSQGKVAAIPLEVQASEVGSRENPARANLVVRANGDQRFVVPVSVTVRPPAPSPWRSVVKHLAPLGVLLLCLLGLAARDYAVAPHDTPKVVVETTPNPPELPVEPIKVKVDDGPVVFTRIEPKTVSRVEDAPEERTTGVTLPVKVDVRDEPEERIKNKKNLTVDPEPRIEYRYDADQRFGLRTLKDRAGAAMNKKLTCWYDGRTNNARLKVDGIDMEFGKGPGKWLKRGELIPNDPERHTRGGSVSVFKVGDLEITQILEIVPSKQPAEVQVEETKELKYLLDTLLVRYEIENTGRIAHKAGMRVQIDTQIGDNDAAPFTIPGVAGLCTFRADLRGKQVPAFLQALEKPDLKNPGLVAHLTLKLGGKMEPPGRVCLAYWESWQSQFRAPWETKLVPMIGGPNKRDDSAVYLYWDEKKLEPGKKRQFGFAYGLGGVDAGEGAGKLGITLGGSFEPGESFTVTAYVNNPVAGQKLTLEVPEGLKAEGKTTVPVPRAVGKPPTSVVTWQVKVEKTGEFRIRVVSSTGLAQSKTITIARGEAPDPGKLALDLVGKLEPGQAFAVEATVTGPAPEQKLRLELPAGLDHVAGEPEQAVPQVGEKETKKVRWEVKVKEPGQFRVGVRSNTGLARAKTLTITKADVGGTVHIELKGDIEPGKAFVVLARAEKPAPEQKLTLLLPDELERVAGEETQAIVVGKEGVQPVRWEVKVRDTGKYAVRVRSSTGVTYTKKITLEATKPKNLGSFELKFAGDIAPGKDFQVIAQVATPVPMQELTLTLPPGLQLVAGAATQPVPAAQEAGAQVSWTVRVVERGRLPVRVDSSTGIARTSTITLSGGGPGQIFGK